MTQNKELIDKANELIISVANKTLKGGQPPPKRKRADKPSELINCNLCPEETASKAEMEIHKLDITSAIVSLRLVGPVTALENALAVHNLQLLMKDEGLPVLTATQGN